MKNFNIAVLLILLLTLLQIQPCKAQAFFKESVKSNVHENIIGLYEWPDKSILLRSLIGFTSQREIARNRFVRLNASGDTLAIRDWIIEDGDTLLTAAISESQNNRIILSAYAFNDDSLYMLEMDTNLIVTYKTSFYKGNGFTPLSSIIRLTSGNYVLIMENFSSGTDPLIRALFLDQNFKLIRERQLLYRTQAGNMAYDPVNQRIYVNQTAFFDSLVYYNYFRKPATVIYDTNFVQLKTIPNQPMWTFDSHFPVGPGRYNTSPIVINSQNILGAVMANYTSTPNWVNFYTEKEIMVFNYNTVVDSINQHRRLFTANEYDGFSQYSSTLATVPSGDIYCGYTSHGVNVANPNLIVYHQDQWITLAKLNSNLQLIWQKQFKSPPGTSMFMTCLIGSRDNGVIFAGNNCYSNNQEFNSFIGKTDLWGGVVTSVKEVQPQVFRMEVYPNPATEQLHWQCEEPRKGRLLLHDLQGQLVLEKNLTMPNSIEVAELPAGLYTWQFLSEQGESSSGKFVKK